MKNTLSLKQKMFCLLMLGLTQIPVQAGPGIDGKPEEKPDNAKIEDVNLQKMKHNEPVKVYVRAPIKKSDNTIPDITDLAVQSVKNRILLTKEIAELKMQNEQLRAMMDGLAKEKSEKEQAIEEQKLSIEKTNADLASSLTQLEEKERAIEEQKLNIEKINAELAYSLTQLEEKERLIKELTEENTRQKEENDVFRSNEELMLSEINELREALDKEDLKTKEYLEQIEHIKETLNTPKQ